MRIIISIDDQVEISQLIENLKSEGMTIDHIMTDIAIITGQSEPQTISKLSKIVGVLAIEQEKTFFIQ